MIGLLIGGLIYYKIELGFIGLIIGVIVSFFVQYLLNKLFIRKTGLDMAITMLKGANEHADNIFRKTAEEYVDGFFTIYKELKGQKNYQSPSELHMQVLYENPDSLEEGEDKEIVRKCCSTIEGACYWGLLYLEEYIKELSAYRARQFIEYIDYALYRKEIKRQSQEDKNEILKVLKLASIKL